MDYKVVQKLIKEYSEISSYFTLSDPSNTVKCLSQTTIPFAVSEGAGLFCVVAVVVFRFSL